MPHLVDDDSDPAQVIGFRVEGNLDIDLRKLGTTICARIVLIIFVIFTGVRIVVSRVNYGAGVLSYGDNIQIAPAEIVAVGRRQQTRKNLTYSPHSWTAAC